MIALLIPQLLCARPEEHRGQDWYVGRAIARCRTGNGHADQGRPDTRRTTSSGTWSSPEGATVREVEDAQDQQHRVVGGLPRSGPDRRPGRSRRGPGCQLTAYGAAERRPSFSARCRTPRSAPGHGRRRCHSRRDRPILQLSPNTSTRQISPLRFGSSSTPSARPRTSTADRSLPQARSRGVRSGACSPRPPAAPRVRSSLRRNGCWPRVFPPGRTSCRSAPPRRAARLVPVRAPQPLIRRELSRRPSGVDRVRRRRRRAELQAGR